MQSWSKLISIVSQQNYALFSPAMGSIIYQLSTNIKMSQKMDRSGKTPLSCIRNTPDWLQRWSCHSLKRQSGIFVVFFFENQYKEENCTQGGVLKFDLDTGVRSISQMLYFAQKLTKFLDYKLFQLHISLLIYPGVEKVLEDGAPFPRNDKKIGEIITYHIDIIGI